MGKREGGWLGSWRSEGGGGGPVVRGTLVRGGPGRQRRGHDGGGWQSGDALMREQGRGQRRQVGWSRGWGPVAEGEKKEREGDRWVR
jgi:hypothetical protein